MTDGELCLKEIRPVHDEVLSALHKASFTSPWPQNSFSGLLALPNVFGWIAGVSEPCGFTLLQSAADETEILLLAVIPSARRRGIGRNLVRRALDSARADGITACHLEVAANNTAALALYKGLGFERVGQRPGYYRRLNSLEDALIMRCRL